MPYYRFKCGAFIEAINFNQAKEKFIEQIRSESENKDRWHKCTCVGLSHRFKCPQHLSNLGEIPY